MQHDSLCVRQDVYTMHMQNRPAKSRSTARAPHVAERPLQPLSASVCVKCIENALWESKSAQDRPVVRLQPLQTGPDRVCSGRHTHKRLPRVDSPARTDSNHAHGRAQSCSRAPTAPRFIFERELGPKQCHLASCPQGLCRRSPRPVNGWPVRDSCTPPTALPKHVDASH